LCTALLLWMQYSSLFEFHIFISMKVQAGWILMRNKHTKNFICNYNSQTVMCFSFFFFFQLKWARKGIFFLLLLLLLLLLLNCNIFFNIIFRKKKLYCNHAACSLFYARSILRFSQMCAYFYVAFRHHFLLQFYFHIVSQNSEKIFFSFFPVMLRFPFLPPCIRLHWGKERR
jgi:hypothetical protein